MTRLLAGSAVLRPVVELDLPALTAIVQDPFVAAWWPRYDADRLREDLLGDPSEHDGAFTVEVGGRVAGMVQWNEEPDPDYRHAGIDLFLGEVFAGQGLGRAVVSAVGAWLVDERGHHRLTIDPSAGNERAVRAYAAVGFRPVGVLRSYERAPDGTLRDGLLMDLLAPELVRWHLAT